MKSTLADCLLTEFRLAATCTHFRPHNFKVGVGYTLGKVPKGQEKPLPEWIPKNLAAVSEKLVDDYFVCAELKGSNFADLPSSK